MTERSLNLVVRRVIRATPERLFEAWTTAAQLEAWWGPRGVRCSHAEVDARVGGRYRIDNVLPDGRVLRISGEFIAVEPPERLVYTWRVEPGSSFEERVTVRFEKVNEGTDVVVTHERIADEAKRDEHRGGWDGCLDGLLRFSELPPGTSTP